jgi:hypothetical protein
VPFHSVRELLASSDRMVSRVTVWVIEGAGEMARFFRSVILKFALSKGVSDG